MCISLASQVEFSDSVIPNVFTVWYISLASQVEFGNSVIPNVFTVWCISLASQVEFADSIIPNVFTLVYFFGPQVEFLIRLFQMYLQYGLNFFSFAGRVW